MKKILLGVGLTFVLLLGGCSALMVGFAAGVSPSSDALPQGTVSAPAPGKSADEPKPKVSTCDAAREAILTGSGAEIDAAMKALVKDKSADANARENAQSYLKQDTQDQRDFYADLVQFTCAV